MKRPKNLRWLVLLVFFIPLLDIESPLLQYYGSSIIPLTIVSLLACTLLLIRLDRPISQTLWYWAILFIFLVGYYIKTFWFGFNVDPLELFLSDTGRYVTYNDIAQGYGWITLAFVSFCMLSWFLLGFGSRESWETNLSIREEEPIPRHRLRNLLVVSFIASIVLSGIREIAGIRILGTEVLGETYVRLPFHLEQVVLRLQEDIVPAILLLIVWLANRQGHRWLSHLAIIALLAHYVILSIITTSRSGLVVFSILLLFLWLLSKSLTKQKLFLIIGSVLLTIVLFFPLMSYSRYYRSGQNETALNSIVSAYDFLALSGNWNWRDQTIFMAQRVIFRTVGAEGVWFAQHAIGSYPVEGLLDIRGANFPRINTYYTLAVYKSPNIREQAQAGFVGAGLLLGGAVGVVGLWTGFLLLGSLLWGWFSHLRTAPVALTVTAYYLWFVNQSALIDYRTFVGLLLAVLGVEWTYRNVLCGDVDRARYPQSLDPGSI